MKNYSNKNVRNLLNKGSQIIKQRNKGINASEAYTEALLLLEHATGKDKTFLLAHPEFIPHKTKIQKFLSYTKRRKQNEPIAYIIGYKYFYGYKFKVNRHVLIPRPETEQLVELAVNEYHNKSLAKTKLKKKKLITIVDVGTGSGCIAISIAKEIQKIHSKQLPQEHRKISSFRVLGLDISDKALKVARENSRRLKATNTEFYKSNLLNYLIKKGIQADIIVANLPYVNAYDYRLLDPQITDWEPKIALVDKGQIAQLKQQIKQNFRFYFN